MLLIVVGEIRREDFRGGWGRGGVGARFRGRGDGRGGWEGVGATGGECLGDMWSVLLIPVGLLRFCNDRGFFPNKCYDLVDEGERDCACG